jgi:putative ABC transport system substrate-binding protein
VTTRRHFVLGLGALGASRLARAQPASQVPRIGYLFSFVPAEGKHLWEACRQGLRELGYEEGRNITLEPRWAEGRHELLPGLVAELIRLRVDVVVAAATPASLAAKAGAGRIPIVIVAVADPVKVGLVASLARPGGNITGLTLLTPELSGRRLQLVTDMLGRIESVALLLNPDNRSHDVFLEETQAAARMLGIVLRRQLARNPQEIGKAFEFGTERPGALVVFDDPVLWSHRKQIVALASSARLPAVYGYSEFVDDGGLLSYGPHRPELYRRTASYVDRILKGANPADLAVERPVKFELVLNLKTARALGLKVPQPILLSADRVIE